MYKNPELAAGIIHSWRDVDTLKKNTSHQWNVSATDPKYLLSDFNLQHGSLQGQILTNLWPTTNRCNNYSGY